MAFENLDLKAAYCFGYESPLSACWQRIAQETVTTGWTREKAKAIEESLKKNVDSSYQKICMYKLVDLDTDITWQVSFICQKSMWELVIADSPDAEVSLDEKQEFFKSEMFRKVAVKSSDYIEAAKKTFKDIVQAHLENGEMLKVDEVKLAAIDFCIQNSGSMDNLRSGKFIW